MVVFAGYDDPIYYDDLWTFNATLRAWTHVTYKALVS